MKDTYKNLDDSIFAKNQKLVITFFKIIWKMGNHL